MIPYGRQSISDRDVAAVTAVLRSDFLTQGPAVPAFEEAVARYTGAEHAVAVNSATSALHIACLALGVQPGDEVWTSPISFVASANCALYCGAKVDFVDIDPRTFNMSVAALEQKLVDAAARAALPKVVIPVHMAGQSADMAGIAALAKRYGFRVIEDASHAVGARYGGEPVGDCRHSDITVFSFHPVKIITSAEGGMAMTNDEALAGRMRLLRSHGITREADQLENEAEGAWYYEQQLLGFNYRMTDLQAALGTSQMERLDAFVSARRKLASRYDEALKSLPLATPYESSDCRSSFHLYIIRFDRSRNSFDHKQAFDRLRAAGIGVNLHYYPIYLQPYYRRLGFAPGHCPEAERYYREAISIPLFPDLSEADQDRVVEAVGRTVDPS